MADAGSIPAVVLFFSSVCLPLPFETALGNHPRVSAMFSVVLGHIAAVCGKS